MSYPCRRLLISLARLLWVVHSQSAAYSAALACVANSPPGSWVPGSFRLKKGAALSLALESFTFLPPPHQLTALSPEHLANRLLFSVSNHRQTVISYISAPYYT